MSFVAIVARGINPTTEYLCWTLHEFDYVSVIYLTEQVYFDHPHKLNFTEQSEYESPSGSMKESRQDASSVYEMFKCFLG